MGAGCLLALTPAAPFPRATPRVVRALPLVGMLLIAASCVFIEESPRFPGWLAVLPVAGTVAVILPCADCTSPVEKWLSTGLLVLVGRMSYSLYLWHWPVFSLVDYHLFLAPDSVRLGAKIGISFAAAGISFLLVENPMRAFLNQREKRITAFVSMGVAVAVCVLLGMSIRRNNYVNAEPADVARGGLVFPGESGVRTVVLMGDSNGAMYGRLLKDICEELGYRLIVICVNAADPLPGIDGGQSRLWNDSLAVVRRERPDCLVLACRWETQLAVDKDRLAVAVDTLRPLVGRLLILNQPPILPALATRSAIREGARPPFFEELGARRNRLDANEYLHTVVRGNVSVLDVASRFEGNNGEAIFLDAQGRQLYHDATHLSSAGVERIRPVLLAAIRASGAG